MRVRVRVRLRLRLRVRLRVRVRSVSRHITVRVHREGESESIRSLPRAECRGTGNARGWVGGVGEGTLLCVRACVRVCAQVHVEMRRCAASVTQRYMQAGNRVLEEQT